jgi:methionyl-tRNA formyltransferase
MDTGPMLLQEKYVYRGDETSAVMHDYFSECGAALLLTTLDALENNSVTPVAQNNAFATHAAKIQKIEAVIDWHQSTLVINHKIRAFNAWPVANTIFMKDTLRIWEAKVIDEKTNLSPGTLARADKNGVWIATGDGVLGLQSVQLPGKKIISAHDFLHGHNDNLIVGKTRFGDA